MRDFSNYISELPANHMDALHRICTDFFEIHAKNTKTHRTSYVSYRRHEYQMLFRIAAKFISNFGLEFEIPANVIGNEDIWNFFNEFDVSVSGWLAEQTFELKYAPTSDSIQLGSEKAQFLQKKTSELRDIVLAAAYIDEHHRRRLLDRLEKFQTQLHLSISSKDVFMAGWAEVNDMIEDTGNKAKPIVDRFREIVSAVRSRDSARIGEDAKPKQITDQSENDVDE